MTEHQIAAPVLVCRGVARRRAPAAGDDHAGKPGAKPTRENRFTREVSTAGKLAE
ncbi:hypothetical protein ACWED2_17240 [Amycolatopsis sp. NPDC005003]